MVGAGGFGPPKSVTTDLQSAPFGRSGTLPGAGDRSRTNNLLITNQLLCHCATPASLPPGDFYIISKPFGFVNTFFEIFYFFGQVYFYSAIIHPASIITSGIVRTESIDVMPTSCAAYSGSISYISPNIVEFVAQGSAVIIVIK